MVNAQSRMHTHLTALLTEHFLLTLCVAWDLHGRATGEATGYFRQLVTGVNWMSPVRSNHLMSSAGHQDQPVPIRSSVRAIGPSSARLMFTVGLRTRSHPPKSQSSGAPWDASTCRDSVSRVQRPPSFPQTPQARNAERQSRVPPGPVK